jgi:hypothetical protein
MAAQSSTVPEDQKKIRAKFHSQQEQITRENSVRKGQNHGAPSGKGCRTGDEIIDQWRRVVNVPYKTIGLDRQPKRLKSRVVDPDPVLF